MNILIAPNTFKGSLSAFDIAKTITKAFKTVFPESHFQQFPVADGGDGTAEVLFKHFGGERIDCQVLNPIGQTIQAPIYITPQQTAVIELADASGLKLLRKSEYNPLKSSTFGTGQLIKAAIDKGCKRIILGIGGSATNDAGLGLLQALGIRFYNQQHETATCLGDVSYFDCDQLYPKLKNCDLIIPCDVANPLIGEHGAAHIFAPQKGANEDEVKTIAKAHLNFANKIEKQFGISVHQHPYTGSAGGTAAGLLAFLQAKLVQGSAFILDELQFDDAVKNSDLVITGEGKIDEQSNAGKAPFEVAKRAQKYKKSVIAIGGGIPADLDDSTYQAALSICNEPMSLAYAMANAQTLLFAQALQIARLIKIGRKLS